MLVHTSQICKSPSCRYIVVKLCAADGIVPKMPWSTITLQVGKIIKRSRAGTDDDATQHGKLESVDDMTYTRTPSKEEHNRHTH